MKLSRYSSCGTNISPLGILQINQARMRETHDRITQQIHLNARLDLTQRYRRDDRIAHMWMDRRGVIMLQRQIRNGTKPFGLTVFDSISPCQARSWATSRLITSHRGGSAMVTPCLTLQICVGINRVGPI